MNKNVKKMRTKGRMNTRTGMTATKMKRMYKTMKTE